MLLFLWAQSTLTGGTEQSTSLHRALHQSSISKTGSSDLVVFWNPELSKVPHRCSLPRYLPILVLKVVLRNEAMVPDERPRGKAWAWVSRRFACPLPSPKCDWQTSSCDRLTWPVRNKREEVLLLASFHYFEYYFLYSILPYTVLRSSQIHEQYKYHVVARFRPWRRRPRRDDCLVFSPWFFGSGYYCVCAFLIPQRFNWKFRDRKTRRLEVQTNDTSISLWTCHRFGRPDILARERLKFKTSSKEARLQKLQKVAPKESFDTWWKTLKSDLHLSSEVDGTFVWYVPQLYTCNRE